MNRSLMTRQASSGSCEVPHHYDTVPYWPAIFRILATADFRRCAPNSVVRLVVAE